MFRFFYKSPKGEWKALIDQSIAVVDSAFLNAKQKQPGLFFLYAAEYGSTHGLTDAEIQSEVAQIRFRGMFGKWKRAWEWNATAYTWAPILPIGSPAKVEDIAPGPRKPIPAIPPEVWNTQTVNSDTAMAAVRDMCKGTRL